eukprot:SAG22_NODE_3497_length_1672_cov_1.323641_1_plen_125_part_10
MDAGLGPLEVLRQAVDALRASHGPALTRLQFQFTTEQLQKLFAAEASSAATLLRTVAAWLVESAQQNLDGVTLTPVLKDFIVTGGAAGDSTRWSPCEKLDQLRALTRAGRFDRQNALQVDLEFHR